MHAQYDPEDRPVEASLEPDYFEFDSEPELSPLSLVPVSPNPIAVQREDLSKEQLKGTRVSVALHNPAP